MLDGARMGTMGYKTSMKNPRASCVRSVGPVPYHSMASFLWLFWLYPKTNHCGAYCAAPPLMGEVPNLHTEIPVFPTHLWGPRRGVLMSHVDFKKYICHPADFKKCSCRPVECKNVHVPRHYLFRSHVACQ